MMKATLSLAMVLALLSMQAIQADTTQDFDTPGTPFTLDTFGDPGGASVVAGGGNPGDYLQLTGAVNGQNNWATLDRSDAGAFDRSILSFDFRITPDATPSADGFAFSLADTSIHGVSGGHGGPPGPVEDPAIAGVLGLGFDTWSNQGDYDDPNVPTGSDYQEISLFWDGALVARIDDTRSLVPPLTLDDGVWHHVEGNVDFAGASVDLSVDGNPIFGGLAVPGLAPFESRVMMASRTGGENAEHAIDNINVKYIPEPATLSLLAALGVAGAILSMWRRKRG